MAAILCAAFGTVLLLRALDRSLNHDEHQFLAPAALLSREGLLPYRDYPLFHLPNLIFAYAAAERLTGDLILGAKLVCFAATLLAGTVIVFLVVARRDGSALGTLAVAATFALAPSLYFLATVPDAFVFGNLEFPRLRLLDPENERIRKTTTLWRKLRYVGREVILPGWSLVVAFAGSMIAAGGNRRPGQGLSAVTVVVITAAALLVGCLLPSRYQYQHFYGLIPLLVLGIAFAATERSSSRLIGRILPPALLVLAIASALLADYRARRENSVLIPPLRHLIDPADWFSTRAAKVGAEIRGHLPAGRVLTLAPAWPLAGGLGIYPEFATGPFAWRSAEFVPPQRRPALHMIAPADLAAFLAERPPDGILTGVEVEPLEAPPIRYAQEHGFRAVKLAKKRELWLPPAPPK